MSHVRRHVSAALAALTLGAAATLSAALAEEPTIALALGQRNSGFHQAIACGARAAAVDFKARINVQAAPHYSAADQIPLLYAVLATKPDAIVLDPTNTTALVAPIREVVREGVKVIAVDTTIDEPGLLSAVIGTDNLAVGREAAKALVRMLGDRTGKVAQINSIPGISTVDDRIRGFEEEIRKHPNLTYIGNQFVGDEDVPKAQSAFVSLMSANPDLVGVAAQSNNPAIGMAGGIRVTGVADQVVAVGVDADDPEIEALREGLIDALVIQQPYEMGYLGVREALNAVAGRPVTTPIGTGTVTATKDTIDRPEVAKYLYVGNCM
ncbi:substrate-binding domain-containing protein [Azospirillum sp. ST 5-10]|uniref:substrate-binding domain-containing protein n=1 Tax=unclassified Azospirillum TaxID=2630922 RepID=UPI003F4A5F95